MPITLRASNAADIAAIHLIYSHAVIHGTASWELEPPDIDELARRRDAILAGGYPYIVAEEAGAVLGYAYASAYRPRAAYRATVEDSIYVATNAQGRGVGRLLLAELMADCERRGFRQMIGVIGDGTGASTGSMRLHEALGFTLIGVAKGIGFKHGRWLDQVLMQKALGEGSGTGLR